MRRMYRIRHAWLGYLTELSPDNTTFVKAEAMLFTLSEATGYIDSREFARDKYTLESVSL